MHLFERSMSVVGWFATGSRVICKPAVEGTDEDFVIFTDNLHLLRRELEALGYKLSAHDKEKYKLAKNDPFQQYNTFDAYRHPDNDDNLIVTNIASDFTRWKVATLVATELNVVDKQQRIMLFRAIRSGGLLFTPAENIEL